MAKANARRSNPGVSYDEAVDVTKGFHGREPIEEDEIVEIEHYDKNLGELFTLLELNICHPDNDYDDDSVEIKLVPIDFAGCNVKVGTNKQRRQLYFIGGDQSLDLEELEDELGISLDASGEGRQYVNIGEVYSIAYHTDKWHLQGPKSQKNGVDYEHTFGEEENGEWPELLYDKRNKKLIFVGGTYEVRDEGLFN